MKVFDTAFWGHNNTVSEGFGIGCFHYEIVLPFPFYIFGVHAYPHSNPTTWKVWEG